MKQKAREEDQDCGVNVSPQVEAILWELTSWDVSSLSQLYPLWGGVRCAMEVGILPGGFPTPTHDVCELFVVHDNYDASPPSAIQVLRHGPMIPTL